MGEANSLSEQISLSLGAISLRSDGENVGCRAMPEPTVIADGAKVEFSVGISADPGVGDKISSPRMSILEGEDTCIRNTNTKYTNFFETEGLLLPQVLGISQEDEEEAGCDYESEGNSFSSGSRPEACTNDLVNLSENIILTKLDPTDIPSLTGLSLEFANFPDSFHFENRERIRAYNYESTIGRYRYNGGVHKCFTTMEYYSRTGELRCAFDSPPCGELINTCLDCMKIISKRDRRCKACRYPV